MNNFNPKSNQFHKEPSNLRRTNDRKNAKISTSLVVQHKAKTNRWPAIWFGLAVFVLLSLSAFLISSPSFAASEAPQPSISLDDVESGQLLLRSDTDLSAAILISTDVKISISGTISRTIVSQRFINTGEVWAEGVYVFPIDENSAVDTLKMRIGDRFIEGIIKEKKAAKAAYEKAKDEGKKASLIEQQKPNLFTNTIANIGPSEVVTVQIEFQTKLSPKNGFWEMRVPLVSAPRYTSQPILQQVQFGTGQAFQRMVLNTNFNESTRC